ncbi:hypothetical protein OPIT5_13795 [Opitutaceae bacterium TAV5]|nr:hypothetical protein OPIT5_13795 [Opitutaceae bacterium TAV5]
MRSQKVTMQTLADELKISRATVSYVLAGQARQKKIPPETEARIREAAWKHRFVPNYWARSLARQDRSGVGLLFPDATMNATQDIVAGIQSVLEKAREASPGTGTDGIATAHGSFLSITCWDAERERAELDALLGKRIAGLICLPGLANAAHYLALRKNRFPMVYVTDKLDGDDEYFVMIDGADAVHKIFDHLESLGHRRIVVIGPDGASPTTEERYAAVRVRLERLGVAASEGLVSGKTGQEETIFAAVDRVLGRPAERRPTAILGINDTVAYQIMHQVMSHGLTPGKEISLAGIGDMQMSRYQMVSLTTVQERRYEFGRIAATLLLDQINGAELGEGAATGLRIKGELVVRRSSGAVPQ